MKAALALALLVGGCADDFLYRCGNMCGGRVTAAVPNPGVCVCDTSPRRVSEVYVCGADGGAP